MSAIPFSMLGSSGALQSQVSEFQPFPEKLLTEYFMFGYQFDPSNWVPLNPRSGPYNPMNDLLNPLSVDSNELLQRQSIEYIEEQMLRQRWNDIKEKELFIRMVPERLRKTVGDLYDRGIFRASLSQTEMDKTIDSLITQGTLGTYDAGRLRALIGQRATFSTLTSQRTAENNIGELEAIISQVEDALRAEGIGQGNTRQLAREAVDMALETGTTAPELIIREAFVKARQRLEDLEDQEGSPTIGGRPANIDDYSTEQEITDSQALMEAGVGLGSRLSGPTAIKIPGTLTTTGREAFAYPLDPPTSTERGTPVSPVRDPLFYDKNIRVTEVLGASRPRGVAVALGERGFSSAEEREAQRREVARRLREIEARTPKGSPPKGSPPKGKGRGRS